MSISYRGIYLHENVRLYKKDGRYNQKVKCGLDSFINMLQEKGHTLKSEYSGNSAKVLIDFGCGHDYHEITPNVYKKGHGCPQCVGLCSKKAGTDLIRLLESNGHDLLSKYINSFTKVLINFNCGHDPHWISPNKYKNGRRCPDCGVVNRSEKMSKRAEGEFKSLLKSNGHLLLSEYVGALSKVLIDFQCGHIPRLITPNDYKNGTRCSKCYGTCPEQAEENLILLLKNKGHVWVDGDYKNTHTKILVDFQCGHKPHWISPDCYKRGTGCPFCNESKGEKRVREWLELSNIKFEPQKEFDGLLGVGGGLLSYDFYLPTLNTLIEYQGEFHDGSAKKQTEEDFEYQQEHDRRKREYAKLHNINLLEIWYWDFENIEQILGSKLYINKKESTYI